MKRVMIAVAVLIILILIPLFFVVPKYKENAASVPVIKNENITLYKDGRAKIVIEDLTENRSTPHAKDTSYGVDDISRNIQTAFQLYGIYSGIVFQSMLVNTNETDPNGVLGGKPLMFVSTYLDPEDGVMEGYIVEDIKDGVPIAYIYVDEDWKQQIGPSYIFWGRDFEHGKQFEYTEVAKGVYMNMIQDDRKRFDLFFNRRYGGIILMNVDSVEEAEQNRDKVTGILLQ